MHVIFHEAARLTDSVEYWTPSLVDRHQFLELHAPPSPPPTIPTATRELPPAAKAFACNLDDLDTRLPSISPSSCSSSISYLQTSKDSVLLSDDHQNHTLNPYRPWTSPSFLRSAPQHFTHHTMHRRLTPHRLQQAPIRPHEQWIYQPMRVIFQFHARSSLPTTMPTATQELPPADGDFA